MSEGHFDVVMVCTGNICRSPMMEHLLRRRLVERGASITGDRPWRIRSAGTAAVPGSWTHELTLETLASAGIMVAPQPARSLDEVDVVAADLVLVATARHRAEVVTRYPALTRRAFMLGQFARWCATARSAEPGATGPATDGPRLVATALGSRQHVQPTAPGAHDLPDPMGQPLAAFHRTRRQVEAALDEILGPGSPTPFTGGNGNGERLIRRPGHERSSTRSWPFRRDRDVRT